MMEDGMNGRDVDKVLELLAEDRASDFKRTTSYQETLVFRVVDQLQKRNPNAGKGKSVVESFTAFAEWLEQCQTLEYTYKSEERGGQPFVRTLQMTADTLTILKSPQLRRVVKHDNQYRLEDWHEWVQPAFERQLNRWRHLPGSFLPLRITVVPEMLHYELQHRKSIEGHGDTTLKFLVGKNPTYVPRETLFS